MRSSLRESFRAWKVGVCVSVKGVRNGGEVGFYVCEDCPTISVVCGALEIT